MSEYSYYDSEDHKSGKQSNTNQQIISKLEQPSIPFGGEILFEEEEKEERNRAQILLDERLEGQRNLLESSRQNKIEENSEDSARKRLEAMRLGTVSEPESSDYDI